MAIINGTGSGETLSDTSGDDTITAQAGDDVIIISQGGTDTVDGGAGNDRLVLDARLLGGGINLAAPTSSADGLSGNASWTNTAISFQHIENFTIYSSAGSFADNVTTGAGDDIFYYYGLDNTTYAADTIDLGGGSNDLLVADFSALTTHNVIGYLNFTPGHNLLTVDNNTKIDFTNVERLHLIGSALVDNVTGLDGDDILEGRAGNDTLDGAAGNDILDGGTGNDILTGGIGDDAFIITNGNDNAAGGADTDTLTINYGDAVTGLTTNGGPTANGGLGGYDGQYTIDATRRVAYSSIEHFDITTGSGNDAITTAGGNDVVHAGSGDDLVNVGAGLDTADGGIGTDRISADMSAATGAIAWDLQANTYSGPSGTSFTNFEYFGTVKTGSGNDTIVTADIQQDETIDVGGGNNNVTVRNGRDDVTAGSGSDTLIVDYSNATTAISSQGASPPAGPQPSANGYDGYFGDLTNRFVTYHGFDTFDVRTGSGNDKITMGTDNVVTNDIVSLGSGDDIAILGRGLDVADGGIGTDGVEADLSQVATAISIDLNANTWSGPAGTSFTNFEYFYENIIGFSTGSGNDNVVTRNADLDDSVRLGAGDDSVKLYDGTDFVVGYGLDTAAGAGGNDTLVVDYGAATAAITTDGGFLQVNSDGQGWDGRLTDGGSRHLFFYGFDRLDITTGSGNDVLNYFNLNTAANNVFHLGGGNDSVNLSGSTGANFIDGGTGNDTMTGGSGNDTYVVDSASDVVNDFLGGVDEIQTSLASYTLSTDLENLTGLGNVAQTLTGNAAANVIDGGLGADVMTGGDGNDIYYVDNASDQVVEASGGGSGTDEIRTSLASYTLGTNVENLTGTSSAGQTLEGNADVNVITGAGGGDTLIGTRGDTLRGNGGDDLLQLTGFGSAAGLTFVQGGDGGADTLRVDFSAYTGAISTGIGSDSNGGSAGAFMDPAGSFPSNVILAFDGIEKFDVTGSANADTLTTGAGDDLLTGGLGDDALDGGLGGDTAIFSGDRADYDIVDNGGGSYTVTDTRVGGDGVDTITNIENVRFSDGTVAVQSLFNAAPVVDLNINTGGVNDTGGYVEGGEAAIGTEIGVSDADSGDMIHGATIEITDAGAGDQLFANLPLPGGITIDSVNSTDSLLVLIGTASAADYQGALGQVGFRSTSDDPTAGGTHNSRSIEVIVNDGTVDSAPATMTLNVFGVDDPAVAHDDAFVTDEATALTGGNLLSANGPGGVADSDPDGPPLTVSAVNGSTASVGNQITLASGALLMLNADGTFSYDPNHAFDWAPIAGSGASNTPAHDSFTYTLTGGGTATVSVTINGIDSNDTLIGTASDDTLNGGIGADIINGLGGNDLINGGAGADTMTGGSGNDTYVVDDAGDQVIEASSGGNDIVYAVVSYGLAAGSEVELLSAFSTGWTIDMNLTGNEFDNVIVGTQGANILYGGSGGLDVLVGLGGDDTYIVDGNDVVLEDANGGADTVYAVSDYTLRGGSHVELLSAFSTGWTIDMNLTGNEFDNAIVGTQGANILYGGSAGADVLVGLGGNDTYIVDGNDVVLEDANGGNDIIYTVSDYTLGAGSHVELLSAFSIGWTSDMNLTGNTFDNIIVGTQGANILYGGGGGLDVLVGLGGNDTYVVDSNDIVFEDAIGGSDVVYAVSDYTLGGGSHVELLSAFSIAWMLDMNLTGNTFDNIIVGTRGANILDGKEGNDYLVGFSGADTFDFTTALNGTTNVDRIEGFETGVDKIALDHSIFGGLGLGALAPGAFVTGSAAQDADDRIIYDSATGNLYYDADGYGGGAAVQFATLNEHPVLTASDFQVI